MQDFLKQLWEENLGTEAGVHHIEGICLMWSVLNTGFTVHYIPHVLAQTQITHVYLGKFKIPDQFMMAFN